MNHEYEPSSSEVKSDSPIGSITVCKDANSPLPSTTAKKIVDPKKEEFHGRKRISTSQILHGCSTHPTGKL